MMIALTVLWMMRKKRRLKGTALAMAAEKRHRMKLDGELATLTREELIIKCQEQQEQLDELRRRLDEELGGRPVKRRKKQLPVPTTTVEKRLVKDMKIVLRTYVIHHLSNQPKNWEVYSSNPNSMCHIIMNKMDQWPAEWKRED
jgi:hypothetical protein